MTQLGRLQDGLYFIKEPSCYPLPNRSFSVNISNMYLRLGKKHSLTAEYGTVSCILAVKRTATGGSLICGQC